MSLSATSTSLTYFHGQGLHHFPGWPVAMLEHPIHREILPLLKSRPPLTLLEAIFLCSITFHLRKEANILLTATSFENVVQTFEVTPQPPLICIWGHWEDPALGIGHYSVFRERLRPGWDVGLLMGLA